MQFLLLSAFLGLLAVFFLEVRQPLSWVPVVLCGLCLVYQAWWIIPYTGLCPVEVKAADESKNRDCIAIMTANVLTTNRNSATLLSLVQDRNPDILVTLESDSWWEQQLDQLGSDYPHTIKCPLDNLYGMHVYSRLPLSESRIEYLIEEGVPSMHTLVTLPSGRKIRTHFLHPSPPSPTENEESSERDAELVVVARSVAESEQPVIVTGDLNDVAWSATTRLFRKISGLLDPRVGRGMYNTFHADHWFLRWPLDHIFHSDHFTLIDIERLPAFGSDHFALVTRLCLEPEERHDQEGLDCEKEDREWARSKMREEGVSMAEVPTPGE